MKCPTTEECSAHTLVDTGDGRKGFAGWYPQMGGYTGRCIAIPCDVPGPTCWDVLVWHDGAFPFDDNDLDRGPVRSVHHCVSDQFIEFGEWLQALEGDEP